MAAPDVHMLTGGYAADALEDHESREFEEHLADCPDCRAEVIGLREALAALGEAAALPPPPGLRDRVLAQIGVTPQLPPLIARTDQVVADAPTADAGDDRPAPPTELAAVRSRPRSHGSRAVRHGRVPAAYGRLVGAAAAVILVAAAAVTGTQVWDAHRQPAAPTALERIVSITTDPSATRTSAKVGTGSATLVVASSGVVLLGNDLPALAARSQYQLWVLHPGRSTAVSAGLGPAASESTSRWARLIGGVGGGDTVAVTVEPAGGSSQPTTSPVAALKV